MMLSGIPEALPVAGLLLGTMSDGQAFSHQPRPHAAQICLEIVPLQGPYRASGPPIRTSSSGPQRAWEPFLCHGAAIDP